MCGLPPVFGLRWLGGDRWLLIGPNGPWASWLRLPINRCDCVRCAVLAAPNDIARRRAALRRLTQFRMPAPRVLQQTVVAHAASLLDATKFLCGGGSSEKGKPSPRTGALVSFR
jgi:hypothetical protein